MNESCKASNETVVLVSSSSLDNGNDQIEAAPERSEEKAHACRNSAKRLLLRRNLQLPWIEQRFQTVKKLLLSQKLSRALVTSLIPTC